MTETVQNTRAPAFEPRMRDAVGTASRTPSWDLSTERKTGDGESLARGLGWFSIGLGVGELVAGRRLARAMGMKNSASLIQLYGLREIAQGVAVLRSHDPEPWILVRIAGDLLDLASLAPGLSPRNRKRHRVQAAVLAVAGATAMDVLCAYQLRERRRRPVRPARPANDSHDHGGDGR